MSSVFQLLLQPSDFARLATNHAVVLGATAFSLTATSLASAPAKGGGGLLDGVFVLFVHSVFPLDGADITIAQPLRVAVSGGGVSPPIDLTLRILGKASTLARIDRCLSQC